MDSNRLPQLFHERESCQNDNAKERWRYSGPNDLFTSLRSKYREIPHHALLGLRGAVKSGL